VTLELESAAIPILPGALDFAKKGMCTGGAKKNAAYVKDDAEVPAAFADIAWDPQTSGGLLLAIAEPKLDALLAALAARGVPIRAVVGRVLARGAKRIVIR
jgi:selenide,water dikinase